MILNLVKNSFRPRSFHIRNFSLCSSFLSKDIPTFNEPFSIVNDEDDGEVHLNPAKHRELLNSPNLGSDNQRLLKICVLGVPNAGKSTLINQLSGFNACPHSKKTHTTRFSSSAIVTEGDCQLVFNDTPGVVKPKDVSKFKLEDSLIYDPIESVRKADLILVLQGNIFLILFLEF